MSSNQKIETLYNEQLKPKLAKLEKDRHAIQKKLVIATVLAIPFFMIPFFVRNQIGVWALMVSSFLVIMIILAWALTLYFKYRHQFKEIVVKELVKLINPDFNNDPYDHINVLEFNKAKMFAKGERAIGDDLVKGNIDKTRFEFSEIKVGQGTQNAQQSKQSYFFRGLFFYADFNKKLTGETFVGPDKAEKLFGKMGQKLQTISSKGELIKLENSDFEKMYVVHSSDQTEARYILTPKMMEAMVNIREKHPLDFHFSFVDQRVNCAIKFNKNLFEPVIWGKGLKLSDVEYFYNLLELIQTIITEMNLNLRIWAVE
ncbi:DUF3137 domain-containing protein [Lentimicrobium sp. L6]|uniref:DUF3137 domain-containing protein n=1 Tax=Lentimicrobium sp. L6 TaxID=2735916 RepID=UPI001551A06F|nr:DUF3137 domain-containing protein [Lentimicrobium sp. L6]NPD83350.1 DUF3137 domain-containing protein [Lentimicrobium sp. L6]